MRILILTLFTAGATLGQDVTRNFNIQNANTVGVQEIATTLRTVVDIRNLYVGNAPPQVSITTDPDRAAVSEFLIPKLDQPASDRQKPTIETYAMANGDSVVVLWPYQHRLTQGHPGDYYDPAHHPRSAKDLYSLRSQASDHARQPKLNPGSRMADPATRHGGANCGYRPPDRTGRSSAGLLLAARQRPEGGADERPSYHTNPKSLSAQQSARCNRPLIFRTDGSRRAADSALQ